MTTNKPTNIDEYITNFPKDTQLILEKIRVLIKEVYLKLKKPSVIPFQRSSSMVKI